MARRPNPFSPLLERLPAPLKNRYILTLIAFLFVMFFFNQMNPYTQWTLQRDKQEKEAKKKFYEEKLKQIKEDKVDNVRNIEKFAREKYFMKKKNEDVFIIVEE